MSGSKWPKWLRSGQSKSKSPGEQEAAKLNGTRRIIRAALNDATFVPEPEKVVKLPKPLVRNIDLVVHVNFHKTNILLRAFEAIDPVTKKKRTTRRLRRRDVFYRKDGGLIDDNPV